MSICSSVWWCYCGCQYYSVMDKTWQTAEWIHLQCGNASHHHYTDKLTHGNRRITTDELRSILFMDKGSVMALLKSLAVLRSTDWVPWLLTDAHRDKESNCHNMAMELRASCCRLSWGTKPGSTTLNLSQEAIDWMAPYDIPKEEIQRVPYAGKTISLSGWGVILVSLLPRESTAISNCYTETLGSLNDCFCQVHPTRKMSEV